MNKYYNINNLFDENGEPIKVTLKIKRKNNYIDYKTAYETSFECNKLLSEKYNEVKELGEHYKHLYSELKKQKDDVVELIKKQLLSYIEQLENNRDKAIEFINSEEFNNLTINKRKKLNDILKGDSDE